MIKKFKFRNFFYLAVFVIACACTFFYLLIPTQIKKFSSRCDSIKYRSKSLLYENYFKKEFKPQIFTIKTIDHITLSGYFIENKVSDKVLVICHGYWQDKNFIYKFAEIFKDFSLLFFDFRAHGSSTGNTITFGVNESIDVRAVVDYIWNHKKNKKIYGLGLSMGAFALAKAVAEGAKFDGIILDSCFFKFDLRYACSLHKSLKYLSPFLFLSRYILNSQMQESIKQLDFSLYAKKIKMPVLVIHSIFDQIIPSIDAYKIFENLKSTKMLWIAKNGEHCAIHKAIAYQYHYTVTDFIYKFC